MSSKMMLVTRLDQRLLMNQNLKQVITILQCSTLELKQKIREMTESNPLIEVQDENEESEVNENESYDLTYYTQSSQSSGFAGSIEDDYIQNIAAEKTLREYLIEQTLNCHFDPVQQEIAILIIDAIDDDGFFSLTAEDILNAMNSDSEKICVLDKSLVIDTLKVIQTFEPCGIAAENTRECLLIQINEKDDGSKAFLYAREIISNDVMTESNMDLKTISKMTHLNHEQISAGLNIIKTLNFHPARSFTHHQDNSMDPEVYVKKIGSKWQPFLTESILTRIKIHEQYKKLIKRNTRDKSYKSVLNQLQEANLIVNGIKRRNATLLAVANYIVETQQEYFEHGDSVLCPINLSHAADSLGFHESTISRITSGKYMVTPHGIVELKYFFPGQIPTQSGKSKSSVAIKQLVREIIESETIEATYSDDEITAMLKEKGVEISRRTVTKYRESMNIPSSYQRQNVNRFKA